MDLDVVIVNATDTAGGAARAAYRLHRGRLDAGRSSRMLVQKKFGNDDTVITGATALGKAINQARSRIGAELGKRGGNLDVGKRSLNLIPSMMHRRINQLDPDIVHLHWVGQETISISEIAKINAPVVWTMHDMWALSASRHYVPESEDIATPLAGGAGTRAWFDRAVYQQKRRHWHDLDVTVVAPSNWLARKARQSTLFARHPVRSIPNGIDTSTYKPADRSLARSVLNLPDDAPLILFGAVNAFGDPRKGGALLYDAIEALNGAGSHDARLVVFGAMDGPEDFSLPVHYQGYMQDDVSLALLYAACDVFVIPSRQENLPNTIMEALACGTPCVGFDVGGISEMIDHKANGFLADPFDTDELAAGIDWILQDPDRSAELGAAGRAKVCQEYALPNITARYNALYEERSARSAH